MAAQLRPLAETDVRDPIPQDVLLPALQTPPFLYVPGTFNTRDLGLLTVSSSSSSSTSSSSFSSSSGPTPPKIRPGFIYRTGGLDRLHHSPEGQAMLRDTLGVRRIFDLRSWDEHAACADPQIEGIEGVWLGSKGTTEESARVDLAPFVEGEGERGYVGMYMEALTVYEGIFREVLKSVRDRPSEGILFHCTAGRDRTGVLAGLLEALAGYDPEVIQTDFLLTRIGYEPAREQLVKFALRSAGVDTGDSTDLTQFYDAPGFYNLVSLKPSCWDAFVDAVKKEYGGFEGYVTKVLGFSEEDLARIKKNLMESP